MKTTKTYLNLILIILAVSFPMSCNSDDDGNNTQTELVLGSWKMVEVSEVIEEDGDVVFDSSWSTEACNRSIIFNYLENGLFEFNDFELTTDSIDPNFFECNVTDNLISGTWERTNGNTFLFEILGESDEATINFTNNNNTHNLIITETDSFNGVIEVTTSTYTFNRE